MRADSLPLGAHKASIAPRFATYIGRREESRRGTHECVRHFGPPGQAEAMAMAESTAW
jgi:hypothetical protein